MELSEAIRCRHSVRAYRQTSLSQAHVEALREKIAQLNEEGRLHIQLVTNEPKAFQGRLAKYGKFSGVTNYLVVAGQRAADLDDRVGYYGEQLVLFAQTLGLNTCWVGLSYSKIPGTFSLAENEKVACYIAIGYGATQGAGHKVKTVEQISNAGADTPAWFLSGVEAVRLAPSAVNQQKYRFEYLGAGDDGVPVVRAKRLFSMIGYTQMDLGIAKYHFEIGAGKEHFRWE